MMRWSLFVVFLVSAVVVAEPVEARRPWKPKVSIPSGEAVGRRIPILDPGVQRKFKRMYTRGRQMLWTGRYRKARAALTQAVRLNPDHPGARLDRARVMLTLGYLTWNPALIQEAHKDIEHALKIHPRDRNLLLMDALLDGLLLRMDALPSPQKQKTRTK